MNREVIQNEAVSMVLTYHRAAFLWCTGLGKSKASIDCINQLCKQNTKKTYKILLIVSELAHKPNWIEEIKKWKSQTNNEITIECYASLKKYVNTDWDIIIYDEAHHLGSELRLSYITSITATNIILLSATLQEETLQSIENVYGKFNISKITLNEAIKNNILPKPKIYLIPLQLDNNNYTQVIIEEWGDKKRRVSHKCKFEDRWNYISNKSKFPNITLSIQCTEKQKYEYISNNINYWKSRFYRSRQQFAKDKWLQLGAIRKRFLGDIKTREVYKLIQMIKEEKRYICFCSSIDQADILGGHNSIHSKKSNHLDIINKFNKKEINSLFAVGMLQEGQNLPNIDIGIITQLDGQERAFIQKFGRSLRAEDPIQFIFYYKNTRDEEFLCNAIENIDRTLIIELNSIKDLKNDSMFK